MPASKAKAKKRSAKTPNYDIDGWAHDLLLECHAIRACPDHGHMRDRTDPSAWRKAREAATSEPFPGTTAKKSVAAIDEAMRWIGDTCLERPARTEPSARVHPVHPPRHTPRHHRCRRVGWIKGTLESSSFFQRAKGRVVKRGLLFVHSQCTRESDNLPDRCDLGA
jgi:hypothetical protein